MPPVEHYPGGHFPSGVPAATVFWPQEEPQLTPEPGSRFQQFTHSSQQRLEQPVRGVENMDFAHQASGEWHETTVGTPDEVECCWRVDKHRCGKILPEVDLGPHLAADHDACGADTRRLICMWIILTKDGSQSLCGASFRRDNLKRHMAIHLGNQKYECSICQRTYSRADTLKGHYKKSH